MISAKQPTLSSLVNNEFGMTEMAIAEELGISRQRVNQLVRNAISKIRKDPDCKILAEYLENSPDTQPHPHRDL